MRCVLRYRWFVVVLLLVFFAATIYLRYRNYGLGVVRVRLGISPADHVEVRSRSPWGSELEFVRDVDGTFRPRDSKRLVVQEIIVKGLKEGGNIGCSYRLEKYGFAHGDWVTSSPSRDGGEVRFQLEPVQQSLLFRTGRTPRNWLGDSHLLLMSGIISCSLFGCFTIGTLLFSQAGTPIWGPRHLVWAITGIMCILSLPAVISIFCSPLDWPGLHYDGCFFASNAVSIARESRNEFDVHVTHMLLRNGLPPGEKLRFNLHGQVFGHCFALLGAETFSGLIRNSLFVSFFSCHFCGLALAYRLAQLKRLDWWKILLLATLGGLATLAVAFYLQGRPECLLIPLACLRLVMLRERNRLWSFWIDVVTIASFAHVSPYCGGVVGVFLGLRSLMRGDRIRRLFALAAVSGIVWALIFPLFTDVSASELIKNFSRGSEGYVFSSLKQDIISAIMWSLESAWLERADLPVVGTLYLVAVVAAAAELRRCLEGRLGWGQKVLVLAFAGLCGILSLTYLLGGTRFYNVLGFYPLVVAYCIESISTGPVSTTSVAGLWRPWGRTLLGGVLLTGLAGMSLAVPRTLCLAIASGQNGLRLESATDTWSRYKATLAEAERICIPAYDVDFSAVVLDLPPWRARAVGYFPENIRVEREVELSEFWRYYVVLQESPDPPDIYGFELVEHTFNQNPVRLLGFGLLDYTPGYGIAIYRRHQQSGGSIAGYGVLP